MEIKQLWWFVATLSLVSSATVVMFMLLYHGHTNVLIQDHRTRRNTHLNDHVEVPLEFEKPMQRLHTCLSSVNLSDYFESLGYLDMARVNMMNVLSRLRLFIPTTFKGASYNHCWNTNATIMVNGSIFRGEVKKFPFSANTGNIDSYTLKAVLHHYKKSFNHSLSLACLPEVFLAGFPKCGSTFLHHLITSHPTVTKGLAKEPQFWSKVARIESTLEVLTAYFALYMANYIPVLQPVADGHLILDGTPHTIYSWPHIRVQPWEINICLLPSVIPELLPKSKFVVVMRNPVSTLYSFFWFSCTRRHGSVPDELLSRGPDIFHERVVSKIHVFNICVKSYPVAKCISDIHYRIMLQDDFDLPESQCGDAQLDVVMYYIHLQRWLSVLPRDRFLFLTMEELVSETEKTAVQIWQFLGISSYLPPNETLSVINEQKTVNYHNDPHLMMRNDTKALLQKFLYPFNEKLAALTGEDKFLWK